MKIITTIIIFYLCFIKLGYAQTAWTGWLDLKFVQATAQGHVDIYSESSPANVNCPNNTQFRAALHRDMAPTQEGKEMMHRTALAAKLSGSRVNLRFYGRDGRCWFERIQIR